MTKPAATSTDSVVRKPGRPQWSWLRAALFNVVLVAAPIALYFAYYVESRVNQTTIANFRALDSAAVRTTEVLHNVQRIAQYVPAAISPELLESASNDSRASNLTKCEVTNVLNSPGMEQIKKVTKAYFKDMAATPSAVHFSVEPLELLDHKKHAQSREQSAAAQTDLPRERCSNDARSSLVAALKAISDRKHGCGPDQRGVESNLVYLENGPSIEVRDCRPFSIRSRQLSRALRDEGVRGALDEFGVRILAPLEEIVHNTSRTVAERFDQFLISDASGRVLHSISHGDLPLRTSNATGGYSDKRVRLDFVNQLDLKALLRAREDAQEQGISGGSEEQGETNQDGHWGVHSRIEPLQIGGMAFKAFMHPFHVDGLHHPRADSETKNTGTTLYMIGIASVEQLSSATLRLRTAHVTDALLITGILLASFATIWLWTSGTRVLLRYRHFLLLLISGSVVALLTTLLLCTLWIRTNDSIGFDQALRKVSQRTQENFGVELMNRIDALTEQSRKLLNGHRPLAYEVAKGGGSAQEKRELEDYYHCGPGVPERSHQTGQPVPSGKADQEPTPDFELVFLMDSDGWQWKCQSRRFFQSPPIKLDFREYFRRPLENRLWRVKLATGRKRAGKWEQSLFLDRITSVLNGTIETVLTSSPKALCAPDAQGECSQPSDSSNTEEPEQDGTRPELSAAVMLGPFQSLESPVLPPQLGFAVVENSSGKTLFHSSLERALTTNFVSESNADATLLAYMDSGESGFVELVHDGTPMLAYVSRLAHGIPWTLVTFRSHTAEDTVSAIVLASSTFVSLPILSIFALLGLGWLYITARGLDNRNAVTRLTTLTRSWHWLLGGSIAATVGYLVLPRYAIGIAGAIALYAVATPAFLMWRDRHAPQPENERSVRKLSIVLPLLILNLAVLPTIGVFMHNRAETSAGFRNLAKARLVEQLSANCKRQAERGKRYLVSTGPEKREQQNDLFTSGWTLRNQEAQAGSTKDPDLGQLASECDRFADTEQRLRQIAKALPRKSPGTNGSDGSGKEATESSTGWSKMLLGLTTFSDYASDIVAHAIGDDLLHRDISPGIAVLRLTDDIDSNPVKLERSPRQHLAIAYGLLIAIASSLLFWLTIRSLAERMLGTRLELAQLPFARVDNLPTSWLASREGSLQLCVVHRSDQLARVLVDSLVTTQYTAAKRARWNGDKLTWEDLPPLLSKPVQQKRAKSIQKAPAERILHVVTGLERLLIEPEARAALLRELEQLIASGSSIMLCSRLVPGYWLARIAHEESAFAESRHLELPAITRWSHVFGPLDVRRIRDRRKNFAQRFEREVQMHDHVHEGTWTEIARFENDRGTLTDVSKQQEIQIPRPDYRRVYELMLQEAEANPALLKLAAAVTRQAGRGSLVYEGSIAEAALRRFTAGAAGYFHTLWATSTNEERLQIIALAQGGFVNPRQTVVLSSLMNRGLVSERSVVQLRSVAFAHFVREDLVHDALDSWRREGRGNLWRSIWPPIAIAIVLSLAFFLRSTPEAIEPLLAILATGLGILPLLLSVGRGARDTRHVLKSE